MKASHMLNSLLARLQSFRHPDRVHDEISEEMRFHIELRAAQRKTMQARRRP
jgi:hypothetical protein